MKKLIIEGKHKLTGTIKIGGAKNSVVALLPAAMLTNGKSVIYNVPDISDVHMLLEMMKILGSDVTFENEANTRTEVGLNMFSTLLISANLRLMVNQNVWTPLYPHLDGSLMFKLYPDSSQDMQLPYAIETEWEANEIDRAELESRTFYLNITEYPTRKLIEVEKYD